MNINAKYFGEVTYDEHDAIHIINGLFGFEEYTDYLPLSFNEENDFMLSLQCLEDETLSFIIMNPFMLCADYSPEISKEDLEFLDAESPEDISFYVISVIRDPLEESTVNLRAPLAVNAINRKAKQIMLNQAEYNFRHVLGSMTYTEGK